MCACVSDYACCVDVHFTSCNEYVDVPSLMVDKKNFHQKLCKWTCYNQATNTFRSASRGTVVPALGDPRRERPPAVCGHFVNVPTHFKVKLPVISGHLPNADADSHLLVVSTCYNGQCKQMPRFRWSFQPKIAGAHPNVRPTDLSNFRTVVW